jgi:two-component system response regulator HydG
VALTRKHEVDVESLPPKLRDDQAKRMVIDGIDPNELTTLAELEGRYVRRVLAACDGNKTHAARVLGIDRRSLYRRLEEPKPAPADVATAP